MLSVTSTNKIAQTMSKLDKKVSLIAKKFMAGEYEDLKQPLKSLNNALTTCNNAYNKIAKPVGSKNDLLKMAAASKRIDPALEKVLQVSAKADMVIKAMEGELPVEEPEVEENTDEEIDDIIEDVEFADEEEGGEDTEASTTAENEDEPEVDETDGEDLDDVESDEDDSLDDIEDFGGEEDEGETSDVDADEEAVVSCDTPKAQSSTAKKVNVKKAKRNTVVANKSTNVDLKALWDFK